MIDNDHNKTYLNQTNLKYNSTHIYKQYNIICIKNCKSNPPSGLNTIMVRWNIYFKQVS